MTTEERRKELRGLGRRIILFALSAAVLLILVIHLFVPSGRHLDPASWFGTKEGEAAIIVNGEPAGDNGRVADGVICLPLSVVSERVNPSVFYDRKEEKLIVTTPTAKQVLPLLDGRTEGGEAFSENGDLFIREDYLRTVTDAAFSIWSDPDRLVVTNEWTYTAARTKSDAPIRRKPGIRSPIIRDCAEGELLQVADPEAEGETEAVKGKTWTRVRTEDGYTGYMESRYLLETESAEREHTSPIGEYTSLHMEEPVNLVFHQTTDQASNRALAESLAGVSGTNVIAPTWFYLDGTDGSVASHASSEYVETAHGAGMQVWAVLNDFDGAIASSAETAEALSTDTARSAIVETVMQEIEECGADGLNLDIELVSRDAAASYLELVRELSAACRRGGYVLSVDSYVPTFTGYLDRAEQARVADYLVVMCYDEHTAGSAEPGSVASLPFLEKGLRDTLLEADREKVIAAIPFFTRLWAVGQDGTVSSRAYGMSGAAARMEELGMTASWDEETGQNYAETETEGTTYRIWLEDADSIDRKLEVIRELGCAGVAEWKLGLERSEIWELIENGLS